MQINTKYTTLWFKNPQWIRYDRFWNQINMSHLTLTHWGGDKMATIFQTTFSNALASTELHEVRLKFQWSVFLSVQLTLFHHWFRQWLVPNQATSHFLNQWWLFYGGIYASLSLNELKESYRVFIVSTLEKTDHLSRTLCCSTLYLWDLCTGYGAIYMGWHGIRPWLVPWKLHAIAWTNSDLLSIDP